MDWLDCLGTIGALVAPSYMKVVKGPEYSSPDDRQYFGSTAHPSEPMLDAASQDVLRVSRLHSTKMFVYQSILSSFQGDPPKRTGCSAGANPSWDKDQCFPLRHFWRGFHLQEHLTQPHSWRLPLMMTLQMRQERAWGYLWLPHRMEFSWCLDCAAHIAHRGHRGVMLCQFEHLDAPAVWWAVST